jgi:uncharacterized damage-inducible protein DinB
MMLRSMPKRKYLAEIQARIHRNRRLVDSIFLPLDQEARSRQPAPGEWSVDQCFQHLLVTFEGYLPNYISALDKPEPAHSNGIFRPSFWARRLNGIMFDPQKKYPTLKRYNPAETSEKTFYPDVQDRFQAQLDRLSSMVEQAERADLQTMCWLIKFALIRYNLGDYLNYLVSHDELHINQAKRALAAYKQEKETTNAERDDFNGESSIVPATELGK